jgi:uncharacterized protein (TIGR00266 family)
MDVEVRHAPSFAAARIVLGPSESVSVESGAMMASSSGVAADAKAEGGMLRSLKRAALGGESLFVTRFTAGPEGGWVDVAAHLPGDIHVTELRGDAVALTKGSWLCSAADVKLDTKWGGFKNLFGGEGGFIIHAAGTGTVVASCYGATDRVELAQGEELIVDSGHVVAFDPSIGMELVKAAKGFVKSAKTGEGLVFRFVGPGWVLTQTRNPGALITWLTEVLPFSRS